MSLKKHKTITKAISLSLLLGLAFSGVAIGTILKESKHVYQKDEYVPEEDAYFVEEIDDPTGLIKAHKFVTPSDNKYSSQKTRSLGTGLIGDIESVWTSYTGKGTTVAILDDGFDYDHPEYTRSDGTSAILSTSRYYYASGNTAYYKTYSSDPSCIEEDWDSDENEWATHGTNTSTTAAAPMGNSGGVGIAPEANILALKIDFSFVALKAAIQYAIDQHVDVINMSLGAYAESFTDGWGESQSGSSSTATYLNSVCQSAYNAGIIVVAAAGNESTWHKSYPACNTKVIGVGAIGDYDNKGNVNKLAEFTNYVGSSQTGEINVDILAPGYVYTATQGGTSSSSHTHTYSDTQGTSFSCPIIAGAACLWKQKYPNGTPDEFLTQLQSTADGIGYYTSKYIPVSGWYSSLSDVGPSNITNGRLNVANLMEINEPYVSTIQSNFDLWVGEKKQIDLDTYNGTITYSSNNTDVATVSSSGLVEGQGAGSATITITATKSGHTATATIGVTVAASVAASSVAFNPKSITLTVGETYDAEATITVTPSNASRIFLFETEDEGIADVNEDTGLVTAVGAGTTNINVVAGYGSGYDTLNVTVEASAGPTSWDKVTNDSQLTNGDYLIVYESGNVAFNGGLATLDGASNTINVSITNNQIAYDSTTEAAKFTINSVSGGYSIQAANGKYIYGTSGSNVLNESSSSQTNSITISSGSADIVSNTSHLRYNSDTNQARFRYFKSSSYSSQKAIQLYKAVNSGAPVPTVSGVTVTPSSLSLDVYNNKTGSLSATVNGTNNPSQGVNWTTGNSSVATVNSSGVVTAVGKGSTTITATSTADGTKSGTCTVTVTDSTPKTLSSISISGQTTSFTVGDDFSFGGTVTAHYSDSTTENVTSSASFGGYNMSVVGTYTVTVSYTYSGTTKTATYQITVAASGSGGGTTTGTLTITRESFATAGGYAWYSWSEDTSTGETITGKGELYTTETGSMQFNKSKGDKVAALYNSTAIPGQITSISAKTASGKTVRSWNAYVSSTAYTSSGSTLTAGSNSTLIGSDISVATSSTSLGTSSAGYSYFCLQENETSASYLAEVIITFETQDLSDKIVKSLSASYSGGDVYVGNSLDESKVTVTASFTDNTKYVDEVLASTDYTLTGFTSSTAGNKVVTVTYSGSLETSTTTVSTTFNIEVINDSVTNVVVTNTHTYHPGETISKSDITVTLSWASGKADTTTEEFTFSQDGYQFTYDDAPSGGLNANKEFSITYAEQSYHFTVKVNRIAYQEISDESIALSSSQFSGSTLSKSSSTPSNSSVTIGGVGFTVTTNAYVFTQSSVNYLSFGKSAGSINNTNAFSSDLSSITVTQKSGARQDGILTISKDGTNYVAYSAAEVAKGGYRYFKYAYEGTVSGSGASTYSNIQTISYQLVGQDNAINVANYIMYADTNGQCTTKLDLAIDKLNTMSLSDRNTFWTSNDDYVIVTARERLSAWAIHERKTLSYTNNTFAVASNIVTPIFSSVSNNDSTTVVIVISLITITAFGAFLFIRKKKEN